MVNVESRQNCTRKFEDPLFFAQGQKSLGNFMEFGVLTMNLTSLGLQN